MNSALLCFLLFVMDSVWVSPWEFHSYMPVQSWQFSHALQHLNLHWYKCSHHELRSSVSKLMSSVRAQDHSQLTDSEGMTVHFPGLLFTTVWRLHSADSRHTAPPARVPGRECWLPAPICQHSRAHAYTHRYSTGIERLVQILPTSVSQADASHNHRTFPCQQYYKCSKAHLIFFSWRSVQSSWEPNLGLQERWKYP